MFMKMRVPSFFTWLSGVAPCYHIHTLDKNEGIFEKFIQKDEGFDAPLQEIFPSNHSGKRRFVTDKVVIDASFTLLKGRVSGLFENSGGSPEGSQRLSKCAVELINALQYEIQDGQLSFRGKRVLQLGCGHGLPGIFACLKGASVVHFQDLNADVLRHVTVPNVRANLSFAQSKHKGSSKDGKTTIKFSQQFEPEVRYYAGDWEHLDKMLSMLSSDEQMAVSDCTFSYPTVDSTNDPINLLDDGLCLQSRRYQQSGPRACERADPSMNIEGGYDIILMSETVYSRQSLQNLYNLVKKLLRPRNGVVYLSGKKQSCGTGGGMRQFKRLVDADGVLAGRLVAEFTDNTFSSKETWKFYYR